MRGSASTPSKAAKAVKLGGEVSDPSYPGRPEPDYTKSGLGAWGLQMYDWAEKYIKHEDGGAVIAEAE